MSSISPPRRPHPLPLDGWQRQQARALREPERLLEALQLPAELSAEARTAAGHFPLRVPEAFVSRMHPGDSTDPLLRQVLPLAEETADAEGFVRDPVADTEARAGRGLLHKYRGRVLLITTGACGIHCRYCFRRHYPYQEEHLQGEAWQQTLDYLAADAEIHEVILSGGDPLTLGDKRLAAMAADLEAIPHLSRLRIHSRQPVVLPARVTDALAALLGGTSLDTAMVLHINHANELDEEVDAALDRLRRAGVSLLNQSVLLKGINDDADTLVALSERMFQAGVLPYYLHQLDRVQGAAHFEVEDARALELLEAMRTRLPGYLVPRLVREVAGAASKLPL
jgi:EF-P beta-lysylation protein EpmB